MSRWLAMVAFVPLASATGAYAQNKGAAFADVALVARNHAIDLRLADSQGAPGPLPLMRGMLLQQGVGANAFLGVGLANIYGRKKGADGTAGDRPPRSRKPAVTFVMRF